MAAVPFKAILVLQTGSGRTISYPCTISDVNAEYWVFPDGLGDVVLPSNLGTLALIDVLIETGGTDTTTSDIFINGKNTGERILHKGNLNTNVQRQFMSAPVFIAPAARVKIKQNT